MTAPIIVGVDNSDTARRAAFTAAKLASALDAPLHLVMAVNRTRSHTALVVGGERWHTDWLTTAQQFLDALIGELPAHPADRPTTRTVSLNDPATAICDEAIRLHAHMIVVGNKRVRGLTRVLGAIATDVARQAACDVLITDTSGD